MLQISEIVKKTEKMFDLFNKYFYHGELTRPAITVSPGSGRGAYGWCSIHEIWNAENELYLEINLCAEYLDRPITEIAATLILKNMPSTAGLFYLYYILEKRKNL